MPDFVPLLFVRRDSVWTEQSVCKVCVDVEILIEGTKFLDLNKNDWKIDLTENSLSAKVTTFQGSEISTTDQFCMHFNVRLIQLAVCDSRNLPGTLKFYGRSSYRMPGSRIFFAEPMSEQQIKHKVKMIQIKVSKTVIWALM